MGNKLDTNVTSGVKEQAAGASRKVYNFIDLKGGGELVELQKKANRTKNYRELDDRIRDGLLEFLYNDGEGKIVHIRELVAARCAEKGITPEHAPEDSTYLDLKDMETANGVQDGNCNKKKTDSQYKKVCWKLDQMGAVGENALHVCLLNSTSIHADLAKRLLKIYPALINDIYISDEFYGENVLHMAIVNEDPAMVKFMLDNGCDFHQRACGRFFTPDDQKATLKDSFEHEWFVTQLETNYQGYTAWGEYPLGFAACLGQEECVRLLIAKGADPNLQDCNGNTALHAIVVHDEKMRGRTESAGNQVYTHPEDMFDILVELGANLHMENRQGLTPLTLSAKVGRREMYQHILEIEREVLWIYGNVSAAAYPLENIDTISSNGFINTKSALYLVVFGEESSHLDMLDGVISHLLEEKWKTFAKYRFMRRFIGFIIYFIFFLLAYLLRPGTDLHATTTTVTQTINGTTFQQNVTVKDPCFLLRVHGTEDIIRMICEACALIGATIYLFLATKEIYYQGYRIFFHVLAASPAKALFLLADIFLIMTVPGRASCAYVYDDYISILAILCTAPYFLFFCRGFKIVGPFVTMIYKMIRTDLLRFVSIYLIFLIGFSQAMFISFRSVPGNVFHKPIEAMLGMFIMSLGEFADIYASFDKTPYHLLPKSIFLAYMIMVTLLLINMLIAMMANTYNMVSEARNEWLRQWAKIILVVEQSVSTEQRRLQQVNYSQALTDGRRALVIRWHQSEEEQLELKRRRDEEKEKQRMVLQKKFEARMADVLNVTEVRPGHSTKGFI